MGRNYVMQMACLLPAASLLLMLSATEASPQLRRRVLDDDDPAAEAPFSASSYDSLGIQPSRRSSRRPSARSLGHSIESQYWWQGPESPFKEGAGYNNGIRPATGPRPGQTVVGCSGDGCSGPLFQASASASSSSSSGAVVGAGSSGSGGGSGSCCNHYWQRPGHPCANYQGPGCPSGWSCINYRSCSNGVITPFQAGYDSGRPSLSELMEFGRPCGNSGSEVCCQSRPPPVQQPVVQEKPHYPPSQPVHRPPPPTYYPPSLPPATARPPVQQPVVQEKPPPVYYPPPTAPPTKPPVYYPPATSPRPTAPPAIYYPPATTTKPPPPPPQPQAVEAPIDPNVPYPGCAAALKCVAEEYCNMEGVMVNQPVFLTKEQKVFRTPLMSCLNVETNQVGFCCRDPLYNDPWPADMPMPPMAKPPVAPVVSATPPPFIQCSWDQECVPAHVCRAQLGLFNIEFNGNCQISNSGQAGVCCNRPPPTTTTTTPPPPPPPIQPLNQEYLPPPPPPPPIQPPPVAPVVSATPPPFIQCSWDQECVPAHICRAQLGQFSNNLEFNGICQSSISGQAGVCCNRAPTTTTTPPPPPPPIQPLNQEYLPPPPPPTTTTTTTTTTTPPPPPPIQPVVIQPLEQEYLPPPRPAEQVVVPSVDYLPPKAPETAAQVSSTPQQCGASRAVSQLIGNGEAALGEYPWHALITVQNGSMTCSGALIDYRFVATSLHCVRGIQPTSLRVRLGEQRVGANDEPYPHYEIPISAVVGHPDFAEGSLFNDVAVLMLTAPAPRGQPHISPICLPSSAEQPSNLCVVTGWGDNTLKNTQSGMLNKIPVSLVNNPECQSSLQTTHLGKYFKLHQSFTCASTQGSINPCNMDGGSPLACQRPDGSYVLAGLSSWSVGCANQQQPGVFVDVPAMAPWIQQQMTQPEANLVDTSNAAFNTQQQFQQTFGAGAGYGR